MEATTVMGSLTVLSPSIFPRRLSHPSSLSDAGGGLWYRLRATPFLPLCAGTLDSHPGDEPVDVIGIGSRKESAIDFCLASLAASASRFRFWTIYSRDSTKVQLLERCRSKDVVIKNVEYPLSVDSCQPAAILVASAGHGLDHIAAIDLLNNVKSAGGLAIVIVLMPFSFEGKRRQKEVNNLVNKLKSCSNFYVVVEADSFSKVEVETLAEALESANNTVLLAMNTISILISKMHSKILNTSEGKVRNIKPSEVVKVLESYGEVKIYYGTCYSVNSAITQAILHCPFFNTILKDFNGLVIIITLTSACHIGESDFSHIIPRFRQITSYTGDVILSKAHEPGLEPNLVVTTLLIMGYTKKMVTQKKGFLSGLLQNLPFFFSFLQGDSVEARDILSNNCLDNKSIPLDRESTSCLHSANGVYPFEVLPDKDAFSDNFENELLRKESFHEVIGEGAEMTETNHVSLSKYHSQHSGELGMTVNHGSHDVGPGVHIAQLWAKKCSATRTKENDKVGIFDLPVGVKSSTSFPDHTSYSNHMEAENSVYINQEITGLMAADMCKKESLISTRAAMMLEAERDSQKCWNPVVEIQYRGGIYRGRCQGGLPEGKGRLNFMDGSFYDGLWKCGKRSGLGTFCYSNGDLFQGPWRDDLMHGKGWLYFHTGDRWFANFWKDKANGEGRFYSKDGSVFFGFFRDGWRHGHCVCIDADGSRWTEHWDNGVLVSRISLNRGGDG